MKQFYLYSATTNSFYPVSAPEDAVQITNDRHIELFSEQSLGRPIKPAKNGFPINVNRGKEYEVWNQNTESYIEDKTLMQEFKAQEQAQALQQKKDDLDIIETKITRLERIKKRTETEEQELDRLIDESTVLYREITAAENEEGDTK